MWNCLCAGNNSAVSRDRDGNVCVWTETTESIFQPNGQDNWGINHSSFIFISTSSRRLHFSLCVSAKRFSLHKTNAIIEYLKKCLAFHNKSIEFEAAFGFGSGTSSVFSWEIGSIFFLWNCVTPRIYLLLIIRCTDVISRHESHLKRIKWIYSSAEPKYSEFKWLDLSLDRRAYTLQSRDNQTYILRRTSVCALVCVCVLWMSTRIHFLLN